MEVDELEAVNVELKKLLGGPILLALLLSSRQPRKLVRLCG